MCIRDRAVTLCFAQVPDGAAVYAATLAVADACYVYTATKAVSYTHLTLPTSDLV